LNAFIIDFFKNAATILSAGSTALENRHFDRLLNEEREAYFRQQRQIGISPRRIRQAVPRHSRASGTARRRAQENRLPRPAPDFLSQHMELFDRSIYENMIYPQESCDPDAIWRLVELLKLNTLIENEQDRFHKRPGDFGARFSGGEKQKLLIARSLLNKKPVMINDEINSALDREAGEILANIITTELRDSTVILVSTGPKGYPSSTES